MSLSVGTIAPDFTLVDNTLTSHTLSSYKGENIILAFFHSYKGLFWHEATSKCGWWFQVHSIACGITGV